MQIQVILFSLEHSKLCCETSSRNLFPSPSPPSTSPSHIPFKFGRRAFNDFSWYKIIFPQAIGNVWWIYGNFKIKISGAFAFILSWISWQLPSGAVRGRDTSFSMDDLSLGHKIDVVMFRDTSLRHAFVKIRFQNVQPPPPQKKKKRK